MAKWDKSQPGNSQPSSLIGTYLTLPNLGFLWVFFKYPKTSKNGNLLFFPVLKLQIFQSWFMFNPFFNFLTRTLIKRIPISILKNDKLWIDYWVQLHKIIRFDSTISSLNFFITISFSFKTYTSSKYQYLYYHLCLSCIDDYFLKKLNRTISSKSWFF